MPAFLAVYENTAINISGIAEVTYGFVESESGLVRGPGGAYGVTVWTPRGEEGTRYTIFDGLNDNEAATVYWRLLAAMKRTLTLEDLEALVPDRSLDEYSDLDEMVLSRHRKKEMASQAKTKVFVSPDPSDGVGVEVACASDELLFYRELMAEIRQNYIAGEAAPDLGSWTTKHESISIYFTASSDDAKRAGAAEIRRGLEGLGFEVFVDASLRERRDPQKVDEVIKAIRRRLIKSRTRPRVLEVAAES